jgi:hypothetical protein
MNGKTLRNLIFAAVLVTASAPSFAGTFVSVTVAPPPLRVYAQPPCPGDGYIFTPGYWAYGPAGYTWAAGAWVLAPHPGFLWTPGYWGFINDAYLWHGGHWGLRVGYYGGVNYGFGYTGHGFHGGHWEGGHFHRDYDGGFHGHHDRRERHEEHAREHAEHSGNEHAHLTRVASHSGGHADRRGKK